MKANQKPVMMILPEKGYDPSEAAITWKVLNQKGFDVRFATPGGKPAEADRLMVTGEGLDWWGWMPVLKKFKAIGLILRANKDARCAYREMVKQDTYQSPMTYEMIDPHALDGMVFPGGHDKSIRPYLESTVLRNLVRQCLDAPTAGKHLPIAGICHGVLVIARTFTEEGRSVLFDRQVTALPWSFERKAWTMSRIFRFWDPHYYRTYLEGKTEAEGYWSVESEIKRLVKRPEQFLLPERSTPDYRRKIDGICRDSLRDERPAWVVQDGNLVTGRWPGDVHLFAKIFAEVVQRNRDAQANI